MKRGICFLAAVVLSTGAFTYVSDQSVKIKIGPVWPRALFGNDKI